jgi:TonB family protein
MPAATIPAETEPQLPHTDPPVANQQGSAATAARVASGSPAVLSSRRPIALPIFVGVAMLLLAAFLFWRFGRDTDSVVMHPVNASVEGGGNAAGASPAPNAAPSVSSPPVASAGKPPVSGGERNNSAPGYTGQGASRLADKPTFSSKKSAQVPLRSPLRSSSSAAAPTMAKDAAEVTDESGDADVLTSVPLSGRPVDVSAGVMAANLVSAPKPSYPTLASLTRTQGNVVMQAVISKDGTVEKLHVIKGHRLLRGAAKNAVRNWRYRPYKIDGVPVDVATTVSVDFSLHH